MVHDLVGFILTPQLATRVVDVGNQDLPAVLVDIEAALGVDVALAGFEGGLDDPHAVLLVTTQVRVEMARLQHVGVFDAFARQPIGVVADQQFLFADQFPVVAIWRAVEAVGTVDHRLAEAVAGTAVIAEGRGAAHPALPGVVLPRCAGRDHLVDWLLDQRYLAGITGGRDGPHAGEVQEVLVGGEVLDALADRRECFLGDHGVVAFLLHSGGRERPPYRAAAVAGQVVPHHLHALGRLKKGYAEVVVQQAVAVRGHFHLRQVGAALFLVVLGYIRAAVARVDVHPVVGKA
ncbi:hypothetical protein D9M69_459520 [compost metagenome]